ncbi:MAG: sensor histidine kinase [Acidobacteria bacterium]|nr:sensor histidine kinase [Acidobacteriota bacterium]
MRRFSGPPTAVIVAVTALIQVMGTHFMASHQNFGKPLGIWGNLLLLLGPAALGLRRRAPRLMLPAVLAVTLSYLALGYPPGPVFLAMAMAIVLTAAAGNRGLAWGTTVLGIGFFVLISWVNGYETWGIRATAGSAWLLVLVMIGEGIRLRSERVAERRRQHQAAEKTARDEYRLTLARDIHDVVAHSLSTINVQASVALHLGTSDPAAYKPALEAIKAASKDSLAEVRSLLGVLRQDAPLEPGVTANLARLAELVATVRNSGLQVTMDNRAPAGLPEELQEVVFRIVQEALTNVVRHAQATQANVLLAPADGISALMVQIDDDGVGSPELVVAGNGIRGMRERLAGVGGSLELLPRHPGLRVSARVPLPQDALLKASLPQEAP